MKAFMQQQWTEVYITLDRYSHNFPPIYMYIYIHVYINAYICKSQGFPMVWYPPLVYLYLYIYIYIYTYIYINACIYVNHRDYLLALDNRKHLSSYDLTTVEDLRSKEEEVTAGKFV
jgi:hypothetical protein